MKLSVDRDRCEGYGLCVDEASSLLHLDDDGELVLDAEEVEPELSGVAEAAVRVCPVAALTMD
ncbi:ferredoxin [Pseudonocardia halophobica]|uniref:Ferredoxin n=1 Tax=Pseudonocardia yuanmonensis TaxID=1095914 RepID=A0ABP8X555_9PSEU